MKVSDGEKTNTLSSQHSANHHNHYDHTCNFLNALYVINRQHDAQNDSNHEDIIGIKTGNKETNQGCFECLVSAILGVPLGSFLGLCFQVYLPDLIFMYLGSG